MPKTNLYRLDTSRVDRDIAALPGKIRQRIKRVIADLRSNPYPPESRQMRPPLDDHWRIQIDEWRVVYTVDDNVLIVEVVHVGRKTGLDRGPDFYGGLRPKRRL